MFKQPAKFQKGSNPGTAVCGSCGKRTWASRIDPSTSLCPDCYDEAGLENEHSDTGGDHHGKGPLDECPLCRH